MTKNSLWIRALLVIAVVIAANVLFNRLFFRLDFTGDQQYTLSNPTKTILKELEEPVTIDAYFSEDLGNKQLDKVKEDFKNLLEEYNRRSNGKVNYKFVNPNESEEGEQEAQQAGIQPVQIRMRERDQFVQARGYLGAVINYGNRKEVLPFIQQGAAMEYALSSSIKKVSDENKPKVAYATGHGEPSVSAINQVANVLSVLYQMVAVDLDTASVENYAGLTIVAPKDSFNTNELAKIDQFLEKGKSVYVAINRVGDDVQSGQGASITTGLETWLAGKGVNVENDYVIDEKCGSVTVQQQTGFFVMNRPIQFPFLPIIQNFADHPVTRGLEQTVLRFASSLSFNPPNENIKITPLAFTSSRSGTVPAPAFFDINKQWNRNDFPTSKIPVAAAIEGKLVGELESKMVVIGDGDFAVNGEGQQAQQVNPDAISLMANAIEWLMGDGGLNELRTKQITSRPINKELSDNQRNLVKWGNFGL